MNLVQSRDCMLLLGQHYSTMEEPNRRQEEESIVSPLLFGQTCRLWITSTGIPVHRFNHNSCLIHWNPWEGGSRRIISVQGPKALRF